MCLRSHARGIAVIAAVVTVLWTDPSHSLSVSDAKCRKNIGNGTRRLAVVLIQQKARCYKLLMRGRVDPSIDCNEPATWQHAGFEGGLVAIDRAEARLLRLAQRGCSDAASPTELGFAVCPPPCQGSAMQDYDSVAACMDCLSVECIADATRAAYGMPPELNLSEDRPIFKCQNAIGKVLKIYANVRMKFEQLCQLLQDRDKPGFESVDCRTINEADHPFNAKLEKIRDRVNNIIDKCQEIDIGTDLDMCGVDADTTKVCVEGAADQCTDALFSAGYPAPLFTPTPTKTPLASETPTPTCIPTGTPFCSLLCDSPPPPAGCSDPSNCIVDLGCPPGEIHEPCNPLLPCLCPCVPAGQLSIRDQR